MRDPRETRGNIRIQHIFGLKADAVEDGFNRIMHATSWTESVTMWFKLRLPFRFQGQLHQRRMCAVQHGRNAQWTVLLRIRFRDPDPAGGGWFDTAQVPQAIHHEEAVGRGHGPNAVDSRGTLPLVVLGDPPDGEGTSGSRLEQKPLQTVDYLAVATS